MSNTYTTLGLWVVITVAAVYRVVLALRGPNAAQRRWPAVWTWTIGLVWIAITAHILLKQSQYTTRQHLDNTLWLIPLDTQEHRVKIWEPPTLQNNSERMRHAVVTIAGDSGQHRELHVQLGTLSYCIGNYRHTPPDNWNSGLSQQVLEDWMKTQCPGMNDRAIEKLSVALLHVVSELTHDESISEASLGDVESVRKEEVVVERVGIGLKPFSLQEVASWLAVWAAGVVYCKIKTRLGSRL